jgi:hypothetical protein
MDWLDLLDDARAAEHRRARTSERLLRTAAEESATFAGSLLDLAEQGRSVRITTASRRRHVGPIRMVGLDFLVVADAWVALATVASVGVVEGGGAATGDRPGTDLLLVEALARVAPERPQLAVVTSGGEVVAGRLLAVGADVLTLRLEGEGGTAYVPAAAVLEVLFTPG